MTEGVGVLRSRDSMSATLGVLDAVGDTTTADPHTATWEATNLRRVATVLAAAATAREETRGSPLARGLPRAPTTGSGAYDWCRCSTRTGCS